MAKEEKKPKVESESKKEFRSNFLMDSEYKKIETLIEKNALDTRKKTEHEQYNSNEMMMNIMFVQETDERFIKFIDDKRKKSLKELEQIEKGGAEEIAKRQAEYDEFMKIRELGDDDEAASYYFYSQAFNSDTINEFKEENPKYSSLIEQKLEEESLIRKEEAIEKIKAESPHMKDDEAAISSLAEKASVGQLFADKMGMDVKEAVSLGLTAFSLATNPVGFFTNKAAKNLIKGLMSTEAGQKLSNNMKERFETFQKGSPVLGKGLKVACACLGVGALIAIGANWDEVSEFASNLIENTPDTLANNANDMANTFDGQTFKIGEKFKNLESLTRSIMPEGSSYKEIQEMTMKLAEYNGIDDPDVIQKGFEFKVPNDLESLGSVDIPTIEINSIEDIKNLDKIDYGMNVKADDLLKDIDKIIQNEYPNDPNRAHEFMVHVKQQVGYATDNNGLINSAKDLKINELHEQFYGKNPVALSDEQENVYHGLDDAKNEFKKIANEIGAKEPLPEKNSIFSKFLSLGSRGKN